MVAAALENQVAQHAIILQEHGRRLTEIQGDIHEMRRSNGDISEMFGKIMAASTHTADQVVELSTTLRTHTQQVDRRFTEAREEQGRVCALKHGPIEQRFINIESGREKIEKKVEDMGENTKITYIRDLEKQLTDSRERQTLTQTHKFEWKKLWFTAVVGLVMLVAGGLSTYFVTIASQKAVVKQAPPQVVAPSANR